jgi:muramoyltetrapeptide carboxypeptidase
MKTEILIPSRLFPGDTVGIAAPASPFDAETFYRGVDVLKDMGFNVSIPDDVFAKKGYLAGSDRHRAESLNRLFADRNIKAIVCAKGGFGSVRLLPFLDVETIRRNPKIFVGFSDISALLWALYSRCRLVTFHGPVITTLGSADQETKDALCSMLLSSDFRLEIKAENGITLRRGSASGPLAGGNLSTLCHLAGTPFAPVFKENILFLEDRGEPSYKIDRMLFQMKLAGCFEGIAGLILGDFQDCGRLEEILKIVDNIFKAYHIPILAGFEAGHGKRNLTLPMGLETELDADEKAVRLQVTGKRFLAALEMT